MYTGSQADQTEAGARVATKVVALMLGLVLRRQHRHRPSHHDLLHQYDRKVAPALLCTLLACPSRRKAICSADKLWSDGSCTHCKLCFRLK